MKKKAVLSSKESTQLLWLLKITVSLCFLGRAWQHIRWDAPFRSLLWKQEWMEGIIHFLFQMDWQTYASSMVVDQNIQFSIKTFGVLYLLAGIGALFISPKRKWLSGILILGSIGLFLLSFLYYLSKTLQVGQFIEYTSQWAMPLLLVYVICKQSLELSNRLQFFLQLALALTFMGHGLYAVGYYEYPGHFLSMIINVFGWSESTSLSFLKAAGVLDFVIGFGIFIPRFRIPLLVYASAWGAATSLARIWAYVSWDIPYWGMEQYLHLAVLRAPHFGLPCFLLLYFLYTRGFSFKEFFQKIFFLFRRKKNLAI